MDPSAVLCVTEKGAEEIAHRTFKLAIKHRGVLLLLGKPQTLEYVLRKAMLPAEEVLASVKRLVQDGFIIQESALAETVSPAASVPRTIAVNVLAPSSPVSSDKWHIDDEAIISEAKFLLVDFCMECFGTQSQKLIERIRACKSASELSVQTHALAALVSQHHPEKLSVLHSTVLEINDTA